LLQNISREEECGQIKQLGQERGKLFGKRIALVHEIEENLKKKPTGTIGKGEKRAYVPKKIRERMHNGGTSPKGGPGRRRGTTTKKDLQGVLSRKPA